MPQRTVLSLLCAMVLVCGFASTAFAQIQAFSRLDGEMLPIARWGDDQIYVMKGGRSSQTWDRNYEVRPSSTFADGKVEISAIEADLDPLRDATTKQRTNPGAVRFTYTAKIKADRNMGNCYALLTFISQGSVGTRPIDIGRLSAGRDHVVKIELRNQVESVGTLHVFSGGNEVRSNQHPDTYAMAEYYTWLTRNVKGLSAAELLKFEIQFPHRLSKDGSLLATIRQNDGKKTLIVYDLVSMKLLSQQVVAEADDAVRSPTWVSDHEVAFVASEDFQDSADEWNLKMLDIKTNQVTTLRKDVYGIIMALPDDPAQLVVHCWDYRSGSWWMNFDVHTRKSSKITEPSWGDYIFDRTGSSRVKFRVDGDKWQYQIKVKPDSRWVDIDDTVKQPGLRFNRRSADLLERIVDVHSIGPDGDILYVSTRLGTDRFELAAYSMSEGVIKKTIARHPKYDLTNSDSGDTRLLFAKDGLELLGIIYDAQKPQVVWLHPHYAKVQKSVDQALPGKINRPIDWSADGSAFIYFSYSDQDPGTYLVYRPADGNIIPLLVHGERLKGKEMAKTLPIEFTAQDGSKIPGYITRPPAATALAPMVVRVHGGPMARDEWGFDPMNQFLASRGYVVLQVNYRGSSGYGAAFQKAGLHHRLDTVVMEDIADATREIIKQGGVDPNRVAIMGASFGGWATYMGLIKYPELFRAGVAIAAVSHWRQTLSDVRWKESGKSAYKFWKTILDREDFAADEKFIDPYLRVAELKQPIYIMHGERDDVVKAPEAKLMLDALRKLNPNVEARSFPRAGHSDWSYEDLVIRFNEVATFLERNLQSSPTDPAAPAAPVAANGQ